VPELALAVYALFGALAFGLRVLLQWRATGSTGVHGFGGRPGSAEWLAGVLFLAAIVLAVAAPVLDLADIVEPIAALDHEAVNVAGLVVALAGVGATLAAQLAMGTSWRIGVDPAERTELVTAGPFAIVRNPIYSAMIPAGLGLTLMVPSVVALAGLAALAAALELQVRVVEEPHLLRVHGSAYGDYAARVGRFVPGVGRLGAR
jgi:protein-S-isoprenylcysteine O-methyltransferase Ste14